MGELYAATCLDCSHQFTDSEGGGFQFGLVHCESCGQSKSISHEKVEGVAHRLFRMMKEQAHALGQPFDDYANQAPLHVLAPKAEAEYQRAVEATVGRCSCGGRLVTTTPTRCPQCKSQNIRRGETIGYYH
jgi:hypothetical protein